MSKKWSLLLALALMVGLAASSSLAATEGAADLLAIEVISEPVAPDQGLATCAVAEARSPLFTAPVFTTPAFVAYDPCIWGAWCRTKRDCGQAGYCEIQWGGQGVCGCY